MRRKPFRPGDQGDPHVTEVEQVPHRDASAIALVHPDRAFPAPRFPGPDGARGDPAHVEVLQLGIGELQQKADDRRRSASANAASVSRR